MPHLVLEYSANVPDQVDWDEMFDALHKSLAEMGFELSRIKSRAVKHDIFRSGDGSPHNAFVYLHLAILSGRDSQLCKTAARECLLVLRNYFPRALAELTCSMTVEMREIDIDTHLSIKDLT